MRLKFILPLSVALAVAMLVGASFALDSEPADALTPTPSFTPTPAASVVRINNTGYAADGLDFENYGNANASIVGQPPACGVPLVTIEHGTYPGGSYPNDPSPVPYTRTKFRWPTDCIGPGEHVTVGWPNFGYFQSLFLNTLTSTATPTPTFTPSATPTYPGGGKQFTNTTLPVADGLDVLVAATTPATATLVANPPGCSLPVISLGTTTRTSYFYSIVGGGWVPFDTDYWVISVRWPSECVDSGESAVISVDVACCFEGDFNFGEGAAPTPTPIPVGGPGVSMAIDCDVILTGWQSTCSVPLGTTSTSVDVVLLNNSSTLRLGTFNHDVVHTDPSRLHAIPSSCSSQFDCNPDFNDSALTGTWACGQPSPRPDADPSPGDRSFISCYNGYGDGPTVPAGDSIVLSRVTYDIPSGASPGTIALTLENADAFDSTFAPVTDCEGPPSPGDPCFGATIMLVEAPTLTPTPTATPTDTPTPTNTPTPTSGDPGVEKIPEGNANNADLSMPKANLWLCEAPAACAGPGEGTLRVVERASNVLDGLGAYEFTVEYDNFVIESINPCDLVFGPGGAGAARGPVDELDTSAVNPDCTPDPNAANNGTCTQSLVLENLVHFGCVTSGQAAGPTGDFDLASLLLLPHPDLRNDLFPGNDNGVLTVLKDNGCELVDTLGHPVTGSINGGLTPFCRDLAVTVRILEGDLDLDCDVDLTDAQSIASRYGAFFGGLLYSKWYDLEPALHDLDIDIKDVQKVFGRQGSTCQTPVPAQPPLDPPFAFGD